MIVLDYEWYVTYPVYRLYCQCIEALHSVWGFNKNSVNQKECNYMNMNIVIWNKFLETNLTRNGRHMLNMRDLKLKKGNFSKPATCIYICRPD